MADSDLDYDDIISQNILIRKEEAEDNSATVEVVTKQSENYESMYNRQAEIYQMDENVQSLVEATLHEDYADSDDDKSSTGESDYEVVVKPAKHSLSDDDIYSSDSDWEITKKPKSQKLNFHCDECDKKCATKRGLDMHKRSHTRQREKNKDKPAELN